MTLINNLNGLLNAENASGAPWFQVVRPEDVDTIPDVIQDQISTAITLNVGATAYNIMATVGTAQWSETPQEVSGRLQYKSVFSFVIPKDRADILNYAKHLNNRGVIAIVRDANGQNRLMGTASEPATFRLSTRTLGNQGGQRNEHLYEIVLNSPDPVPFYQVTTHLPAPSNSAPSVPSLAVEVYSDAGHTTPVSSFNWGDTVYLKATPTNYTPNNYFFFISDGTRIKPIIQQATGTYTWEVKDIPNRGSLIIYCQAKDTASAIESYNWKDVNISAYYLDVFSSAFYCVSTRLERAAYSGALVSIRRSSDNATKDFYPDADEILSMASEDGSGTSLATWIGSDKGFMYKIYDQTTNGNDWVQSTAADQYKVISDGIFIEDLTGLAAPTAFGNGDGYDMSGFQGHALCDSDIVMSTKDPAFTHFCGSGASTYGFFGQIGSGSSTVVNDYGSPSLYVDNSLISSPTRTLVCSTNYGENKIIQHQGADTTSANWSTAYFGKYPPSATFTMFGSLAFCASFASDQSATRAKRHEYLRNFYQCT